MPSGLSAIGPALIYQFIRTIGVNVAVGIALGLVTARVTQVNVNSDLEFRAAKHGAIFLAFSQLVGVQTLHAVCCWES